MLEFSQCFRCGARLSVANGMECAACVLRSALGWMEAEDSVPHEVPRHFGPYEVLGEIARGGMGVVYRARQSRLNRVVALKVIGGAKWASPERIRRFQAEAELAASLHHPNIVPIHEIGEYDGQPFFSMGLIEGQTLSDATSRVLGRERDDSHPLGSSDPGPEHGRRMAGLVAKVARAVHYAHQRGVLHRDLKPTNILLDAAGEPHLTDFGLAKLAEGESTLTQSDAVLGTPAFMAPEQARGDSRRITIAADIYGLGAVLYSTLVGLPPFGGSTILETLDQVLHQEPRPPSQVHSSTDRDLETICLRCLEKDPSRRYASALDVAEELERWLRGEPIHARQTGFGERAWKLLRRRPVVSALALGLVTSMGVGIAGILTQWRRAEQQRMEAVEARVEARRESYFAGVSLAQHYLDDGDVARAREMLLSIPSEFRHWEWGHLVSLCHQDLALFQAGDIGPALMKWSPDSTRLATVAAKRAQLWSMPEARLLATVSSRVDSSLAPAFVLGGTQLALVASDTVLFVDSLSGQSVGSISLASPALQMEASTQGDRLLTLHPGGHAHLWALPGERCIGRLDPVPPLESVRFTRDGRFILGQTRSPLGIGLKIWDGLTGDCVREVLSVTNRAIEALFDDHGKRFVWRTGSGVRVGELGRPDEAEDLPGIHADGLVLSSDGRYLLVAESGGGIRGWDLIRRRPTFTANGPMHGVTFHPDLRHVSVWSGGSGTAILDLDNGERILRVLGRDGTGDQQRFSPDGRFLATAARDGSVQIWSARPGRSRMDNADSLRRLAVSPDGQRGVTVFSSGAIVVWDVASGLPVIHPTGHLQWILCVGFSPRGTVFATGSADRTARVWDVETGAEQICLPHDATVSSLAFSDDGSRLVTGDRHGGLHLWNVGTGEVLARVAPGQGPVIDLAVSGDHLGVAFSNGTVGLWMLSQFVSRFDIPAHSADAIAVAFSPDGTTLASTGRDRRLNLWDTRSGARKASVPTRNHVHRLVFSPDGARLLTGNSAERSAYSYPSLDVWDASSVRQILGFRYDNGQINTLAFSPDGRSVFAGHARSFGAQYVFRLDSFPWSPLDSTRSTDATPETAIAASAHQYWRERIAAEARQPVDQPVPAPVPRSLWPPRAVQTSPDCLDLTPSYNALLSIPWRPLNFWSEFDDALTSLPVGFQEFEGIPFDVRGLVVAPADDPKWRRLRFYAHPAEPVPVHRSVRRLHFLQATTFRVPEGSKIGRYLVRYADGGTRELPLIYGENTRRWYDAPDEPGTLREASCVWRGTNATAVAKGASLRLLRWTWVHPEPERPIATLVLESVPGVDAAPFLVGITAD